MILRSPALPLAVTLAVALAAEPAAAWGPIGHRAVARIAEGHLSPKAQAEVADLLHPQTLAEVALWADDARTTPALAHTRPWHYVDFADNETYASAEKNPEGDVVTALHQAEVTLGDRTQTREDRAAALKLLVHFVGDVHQPLHVGRHEDRGGNDVQILWFDEPWNLHQVWDRGILNHSALSFSELAEFLARRPSPEEVAGWQSDPLEIWVAESHALRTQVYDLGPKNPADLGYPYLLRNRPVAERRVLQAGIRLAGVLNRVLGPLAQPEPTPPGASPAAPAPPAPGG